MATAKLPGSLVWLALWTACGCVGAVGDMPGAPRCGDGVAEGSEACDGLDLRGVQCAAPGPGRPRCSARCDTVDYSECAPLPPPDGGSADSGVNDSGVNDSGVPDAGFPDAGGGSSMALVVRNGRIERSTGGAVDVRGAISCCGGAYGWPLVDDAWMDLTASKGVNFLHVRLGPFMTSTPNGETDWAAVGGGYVETGGKADLTQLNERFWSRVRAMIERARTKGQWVEVDVVDGWGIKHCQAGDIPGYSAWEPAFNVQGQNLCAQAGSAPVAPGSVIDTWIRKVVFETGRYDNVLYQDGNEVSLIGGYTVAWTTSMHDVIRDEEQRRGYSRHLFATNAGNTAAMQSAAVDYVELHQSQAATRAQCAGKPCMVNEYNPNPPLTPAQFQQQYCAAKTQGTVFWYWRHGQSAADMLASLDRMRCDVPDGGPPPTPDGGQGGCSFPQGVPDPDFIATATSFTDTDPVVDAAVNAAIQQLTGCGPLSTCSLAAYPGADVYQKCQSYFAAVTRRLRDQGYCAGLHEEGITDEIAVSNTGCRGRWYGYHICNYGGPLVVWNPGARRGWWQIAPGRCPP